jgi:NADH-quinone oxidoreductase subunit N
MNFYDLINKFSDNLLTDSLPRFAPELAICATIVLMLLVRMPSFGRKINSIWIALPGCLVALWLAAPWTHLDIATSAAAPASFEIFDGLLVYDNLAVYIRSALLVFAVLFLIFTKISGIPDREDSPDFYTLVLGGLLGMCVMASANHLLTVFLGVEMASVPSYALAGILKGRRTSGEAALKYAVYGAGAAGVMLYGISLLAGALGTVHLPTMAQQLAELSPEAFADRRLVLMLGSLLVSVGLAFKLSAVPFHFWAPDVFEGACAEVGAFLSVASKAAALALLIRVGLGLTHVPHQSDVLEAAPKLAAAAGTTDVRAEPKFRLVSAVDPKAGAATLPPPTDLAVQDPLAVNHSANLAGARKFAAGLVALLAAITCTFGNLAAYGQTNIKRLLAYSTIAHAGYMMMPVAAAITLSGSDPAAAKNAVGWLCFYIGTYVFMNLGAFAIVAFLRNELRSEEVADYAGLLKRSPGIVICFSIILISLIGLPPLAGFSAKLLAFAALTKAEMWTLLFIGCVNSAISLFYYIRVVKTMTIDPEPADRVPSHFSMLSAAGVFTFIITIPVVVLGVWWDSLNVWAQAAARNLL